MRGLQAMQAPSIWVRPAERVLEVIEIHPREPAPSRSRNTALVRVPLDSFFATWVGLLHGPMPPRNLSRV